jgi:hypothetical protein
VCTYVLTSIFQFIFSIRRISPSASGDRDAVRHYVRPARGRYKRYLLIPSCVFCLIPYHILFLFIFTYFHDSFFHSLIRSFIYPFFIHSFHFSFYVFNVFVPYRLLDLTFLKTLGTLLFLIFKITLKFLLFGTTN